MRRKAFLSCFISVVFLLLCQRGVVSSSNVDDSYDFRNQLEDMTNKIDRMSAKMLQQDKEIAGLKEKLMECQGVEKLSSGIRKRQANWTLEVEGPVVFSAYLGHTLNGISNNHVIPFDHVSLSEGVSYNGSDGVFVCPREGLYLFMFHIMVDARRHATVALKVNGNAKSWTSAGGIVETQSEGAGNTIVVRLAKGDHVWIAMEDNHGHLNSGRTTFTGLWISY